MGCDFVTLSKTHENWRNRSINLLPSETLTSPRTRALLASDFGHRYTLPLNETIHGHYMENAYRGSRYTDEMEAAGEILAKEIFNADYACLKPLSGHISGMIALLACCKRGDKILAIHSNDGGYDGYMPPYMPDMFGLEVGHLPFDSEFANIDSQKAATQIASEKPRLVLLGASFILFPYDIGPIRDACRDVGAYLGYDGSHVLGLIAGGQFQKPLAEGVDLLFGSTHKTFFGPQGGIIVTRNDKIAEGIERNLTWRAIDNAHWNRIAALSHSLMEMKHFGSDYACQVIENSRALGKGLEGCGIPVKYSKLGYTNSHQLLLDTDAILEKLGHTSDGLAKLLEASDIITDAVGRLGTNEATRAGACAEDMAAVAGLIKNVVADGLNVKEEVHALRAKWKMKYIFE